MSGDGQVILGCSTGSRAQFRGRCSEELVRSGSRVGQGGCSARRGERRYNSGKCWDQKERQTQLSRNPGIRAVKPQLNKAHRQYPNHV